MEKSSTSFEICINKSFCYKASILCRIIVFVKIYDKKFLVLFILDEFKKN